VADPAPIAVVLTAIPVERQAVREHLLDIDEHVHRAGTIFDVGHLPNGPWRVVLAQTGQGNPRAAALAERAISHYQPDLVMLIGVAGRLHTDLSLGDVVVAKKVYAIHGGKEDDAGFRPRPESWWPDHGHVQRAERLAESDRWQDALPDESRSGAKVVVRAIASGEVVLDSLESPYARMIKRHYGDAAAIEMEGAGVALAGQLNESLPVIVLRGISDYADGQKETTDQTGGQLRAARNAAAFAVTLLEELPPTRRAAIPTPPRHVLVSGSVPATSRRTGAPDWSAGGQVRLGDHEYLLVEGTLAERPWAGGVAGYREARGLQVTPTPRVGAEYLWLRQIVTRPNVAPAVAALATLATERELLEGLRPVRGIPRLARYVSDEHLATLVTGWPVSRSTRLPCETLEVIAPPGPPLDEWRTGKLLKGLAGLSRTLATLHGRRRAHRHLTPAGLIRLDDDTLMLRDLGLAGRDYEPGEGPPGYQAPEQRRRTLARPGPHTDVFQLAALAYHLLTGQLPSAVNPLPLRHYRPDLPESVGGAVDAALSPDPSTRPGMGRLGAAFRPAPAADPPEERSCVS